MRKIVGLVLILMFLFLSVITFGDKTDSDSQTESTPPVVSQSVDG
ncbi:MULTISPECIES: hypothetical protein [unclassified Thermosipho (in: thermotogales)]|nr:MULTISPECIES: hypothetical protein [unclassified Thermosipho (in: thermotogales)]